MTSSSLLLLVFCSLLGTGLRQCEINYEKEQRQKQREETYRNKRILYAKHGIGESLDSI